MNQQAEDMHARSHRLWRQALCGDSDGALKELDRMALADLSLQSADLLARLYVRANRLKEARRLWQTILRTDPNYVPSVQALKKLNTPWLVRAVAKKYSLCFGMCVLIGFSLYGLGTLVFGAKGVAFSVMGMAAILAVLGIYLAGLFGWACATMEWLGGAGQVASIAGASQMGLCEHQATQSHGSAARHEGSNAPHHQGSRPPGYPETTARRYYPD